MLLRYLKEATIKKATKTKQNNGTYKESLADIGIYKIQQQELNDEVTASIYGANLYKMIRIKSVKNELENYLYTKVNNKLDNVSNYYVFIDAKKYKIVSVNQRGIDLELITNESNSSN